MLTELAGLALDIENIVTEGLGIDIAMRVFLLSITQAMCRSCGFPALEEETTSIAVTTISRLRFFVLTCFLLEICGNGQQRQHEKGGKTYQYSTHPQAVLCLGVQRSSWSEQAEESS